MTSHVTCRVGKNDSFSPNVASGENHFVLPVEVPGHPDELGSDVWEIVDRQRLTPTQKATDLYRIAATVQSADLRISRKEAFDRWTRDIVLYVPVSDKDVWQSVAKPITRLFSFLTGDRWQINFRKEDTARPPRREKLRAKADPISTKMVCLFSGGLDSFIGAVDALEDGKDLYFVSHRGRGGNASHVSPTQKNLLGVLEREYGQSRMRSFRTYVYPPTSLTGKTEPTTRSRSIVFFSLGVLVASSLGKGAKLLYPENGFISLNIPLTYSRIGSMSTRTTHPHTVSLLRKVLDGVGIDVKLENPYQFMTKGEMCEEVEESSAFQEGAQETLSCAHPAQSRFGGGRHCGYCVPCIIRRAAMAKVDLDEASAYDYDVQKNTLTGGKKEDLRAFEIAVQRRGRSARVELLKSGPMPSDTKLLSRYSGVYKRGLEEVASFLK